MKEFKRHASIQGTDVRISFIVPSTAWHSVLGARFLPMINLSDFTYDKDLVARQEAAKYLPKHVLSTRISVSESSATKCPQDSLDKASIQPKDF